jgi:glycosyltransferase involved in cell wall biosynthesis
METRKPKIAFIVQRFGKDINGGAELHCFLLAKKMNADHDVTILTTCAKEYQTWEPVYQPGNYEEDGLKVIRFNNYRRGKKLKILRIRKKLMGKTWIPFPSFFKPLFPFISKPAYRHFLQWLNYQGPATPELIKYLEESSNEYDAFIFFSHLYYPTALGVQVNPRKSILVPTVHDEKASYFPGYEKVLQAPEWLMYNSIAEKKLAERIYGVANKKNAVAGVGVEPLYINTNDAFEKYKIRQPYILYLGRIEPGKGCKELIDYFIRSRQSNNAPLQLVMAGQNFMPVVKNPDITYTGFIVNESHKAELLSGCSLLAIPSQYESLSMVLLEAFSYGRPVLVNAGSEVLRDHIENSKGGFSYSDFTGFKTGLNNLLSNPGKANEMGENGRRYAKENYSWQAVLQKFDTAIADITGP